MGDALENSAPSKRTTFHRLAQRQLRKLAGKGRGEQLTEEDWGAWLELSCTPAGRVGRVVLNALPHEPRCRLCGAPFAGLGRMLVRPLGFGPSRKNPTICATCVENSPPGGVRMTIGVLFADLRHFTARAEHMDLGEASAVLRRFYACAERVLLPHALIDKLIGDEVMALYIPRYMQLEDPARVMLQHARQLQSTVGYGSEDGAFVELGVGLDYGEAFLGNIGDRAVYDFTAVGDVVNTASRLQKAAGGGEIVLSERVAAEFAQPPGDPIELSLKGKRDRVTAYRLSWDREPSRDATRIRS